MSTLPPRPVPVTLVDLLSCQGCGSGSWTVQGPSAALTCHDCGHQPAGVPSPAPGGAGDG